MAFLIDTSVLGRLANTAETFYPIAVRTLVMLHRQGEIVHTTPQNLVGFRNVATRPVLVNGLGLSITDAEAKAATFEVVVPLLAETPDIYPAWKALVRAAGVIGKQVHDARLVAVCHVYGITHLLTFNVGHFTRLANFGPGVIIVDPVSV